LNASETFHRLGVPLLVSSQILRNRNLGQIDLARLLKKNDLWKIEIGEVKSSIMGEYQMQKSQKFRLYSSQNFLSSIFGLPSVLISVIKEKSAN
jgi:hypothetical protein